MRLLRLLVVMVFVGLVCSWVYAEEEMRFTKGSGDMGQYIVAAAVKFGAKAVATNDLPALAGEWKVSEDQYGAVLQLGTDRFGEVESFLKKAFGAPAHEPSATTDGGKLGWYAAKTIGIAVQFGYDKERTQVTILRPQRASVINDKAAELAKTKAEKEFFKRRAAEAKEREKKERK
jgi:hypothetical protein